MMQAWAARHVSATSNLQSCMLTCMMSQGWITPSACMLKQLLMASMLQAQDTAGGCLPTGAGAEDWTHGMGMLCINTCLHPVCLSRTDIITQGVQLPHCIAAAAYPILFACTQTQHGNQMPQLCVQNADVKWMFDAYMSCNFQWFLKSGNVILDPKEITGAISRAIEHLSVHAKKMVVPVLSTRYSLT